MPRKSGRTIAPDMRHRSVAPLLLAVVMGERTISFILSPMPGVNALRHVCSLSVRWDFGWPRNQHVGVNTCRRLRRVLSKTSEVVSQEPTGGVAPAASLLGSRDAVSCFRNAEGSEIWLVGCYHRGIPSVELVEEVIRTVKPAVVMVELDAHRSKLLPLGELHESEDGLCWWKPNLPTPLRVERSNLATMTTNPSTERGEQGVEFYTAAVEAQACGARILLGDRDLEEILHGQAEARSADEKLAAAKPSGRRRRARMDMEKLEGVIARRSALGHEVPVTREIMRKWSAAMKRSRPNEHAVSVTERDGVMAGNLLKLRCVKRTVAVLGFGHLDGVEHILETQGWEPLSD